MHKRQDESQGATEESVALSPDERQYLLSLIGRTTLSLNLRLRGGKAIATLDSVECRTCLLHAGLEGVEILDDGRCSFCHNHDLISKPAQDAFKTHAYWDAYRARSNGKCIVAFSGGKDSAMVLAYARQLQQAQVVAVFFDNGYIPAEVIENAQRLARKLDVEFVVIRQDLTPEFQAAFGEAKTHFPCQICARSFFRAIGDICRAENCGIVFSGHWYPLISRPLSDFTLTPHEGGIDVYFPLPHLPSQWQSLRKALDQTGWRALKLPGNTTNCEIEPIFEHAYHLHYGYNPAIADLSDQIRVGWLTKEEARERMVLPRLNEAKVRQFAVKLALSAEITRSLDPSCECC